MTTTAATTQEGEQVRKSTAFVASMTFASGSIRERNCDCGDCDDGGGLPEVFQLHKRQRLMETPICRSQERILVSRQGRISIWKLTLPKNADPLVEFGSTHRIVYVQRKEASSCLLSIGKGIIGSSDESKSRNEVNWNQGNAYMVPSNGGKALGWIHSGSRDEGPMELYWCKCPIDNLVDEGSDGWAMAMKEIFLRFTEAAELNEADTKVFKSIIHDLSSKEEEV